MGKREVCGDMKMNIPVTDILGNELNVGDKVTIFSHHGISYADCMIVQRYFDDDEMDLRRAIQIDDDAWIFGLGNHEIIKCVQRDKAMKVYAVIEKNGLGGEKIVGLFKDSDKAFEVSKERSGLFLGAFDHRVSRSVEVIEIQE